MYRDVCGCYVRQAYVCACTPAYLRIRTFAYIFDISISILIRVFLVLLAPFSPMCIILYAVSRICNPPAVPPTFFFHTNIRESKPLYSALWSLTTSIFMSTYFSFLWFLGTFVVIVFTFAIQ